MRADPVVDPLHELVAEIVTLPSAPYHEYAVMAWLEVWALHLRGSTARVTLKKDRYGNLLVRYRHPLAKQPVAFAAHTDHPGFEIKEWKSDRILRAEFLGGVAKEYFVKKSVPVDLFSKDGKNLATAQIVRVIDWKKKLIELQITSKKQFVREQLAFGMWKLKGFVRRGNLLHCRVCDDLMGVVAICAAFGQIVQESAVADVTAVFSRAEEVGFVGAMAVARGKLLPAHCKVISIENSKALPDARIGDGPIVRVGDRSSIFDPEITAGLITCAEGLVKKNKKFLFQRRLMYGGSCEGTAYRIYHYQTGAMCLPLGNYHNMSKSGKIRAEYVDLRDLKGLISLLNQYAKYLGAQIADKELKKRLDEIWDRSKRKLLNPNN